MLVAPVHVPTRVTRSSQRAAALATTPEVVKAASAALDAADPEVPAKRGRGRPRGSKNKPVKGKGKALSPRARSTGKTRPLPTHSTPAPDAKLAGPIPISGEHPSRSGPFEQPLPIPPIDVDGLSSVFEHNALVCQLPTYF